MLPCWEMINRHPCPLGRARSGIVCTFFLQSWRASPTGWTEEARALKRLALRRVLLRALRYQDDVWYYQGLHDVASVLLFTLGEAGGAAVLSQLVVTHLRDATRPDLLAATQTLGLLYPLLRAVGGPFTLGLGRGEGELAWRDEADPRICTCREIEHRAPAP